MLRPVTNAMLLLPLGSALQAQWHATPFVEAPAIYSPASIAVTPDGQLFVGIDEYNSGDGRAEGLSRIVLCRDTDGDRKADLLTVFADGVCAPQGMTFAAGTLYVVHAPYLTAYRDLDGDGRAEVREDLVTGLGPAPDDLVHHIPSGLHLGIDGWLYVSIGDKGIPGAVGRDQRTLTLEGGGCIRVRPDGTGLELVCQGLRNTYDIAISPRLELFTRDNTNDGGGWNVRLSLLQLGAELGYPKLFTNFADECLPALADYGGGSGTGCTFVDEPWLPGPDHQALITTDWGRRQVYRHVLAPHGASFEVEQHVLWSGEHPVDVEADAEGRLWIADWGERGWGDVVREGKRGTVWILTPHGAATTRYTPLAAASPEQCVDELLHPSHLRRLEAQRALLRQPNDASTVKLLAAKLDQPGSLEARIAVAFTLLLLGDRATLRQHAGDTQLRPWLLRALADLPQPGEAALFRGALDDTDPRCREQAAIGLGRLRASRADPVSAAEDDALAQRLTDPDPRVRHAVQQSLRVRQAVAPCLAAIDERHPERTLAALRVLGPLPEAAPGVAQKLSSMRDPQLRAALLDTLGRMSCREGPWNGKWWGTQPQTRWPWHRPVSTGAARLLATGQGTLLGEDDPALRRAVLATIERYRLDELAAHVGSVSLAAGDAGEAAAATLLALDRRVSIEALAAVGSCALRSTAARTAALQALHDQTLPSSVRRSLHALALSQPRDCPASLVDALGALIARQPGDESVLDLTRAVHPAVRRAAYRSLLTASDSLAMTAAQAALAEPDSTVLWLEAIAAADPAHGQRHAGQIQGLLASGPGARRTAAILACGHLRNPAAAGSLTKLLAEGIEPELVAVALGQLGPQAVPAQELERVARHLVGRARAQPPDASATKALDDAVRLAREFARDPRLASEVSSSLTRQLAQLSQVVTDYRVLGPFADQGKDREARRSAEDRLDQLDSTAGWRPAITSGDAGFLWLDRLFASQAGGQHAYLAAEYDCAAAGAGTLLVGSDDGVVVWLNGREVHRHAGDRSLTQDQDRIELDLATGPNRLLFKVHNSGGPWGLCARILPPSRPLRVSDLPRDQVATELSFRRGDPERGAQVFARATCAQCHTTTQGQPLLGPYLGDAGDRLTAADLLQSILDPAAQVAQGFRTRWFKLRDGTSLVGYVTRESASEIEVRGLITGTVTVRRAEVADEGSAPGSVMPMGLADPLTLTELADLLAFLQSRRG